MGGRGAQKDKDPNPLRQCFSKWSNPTSVVIILMTFQKFFHSTFKLNSLYGFLFYLFPLSQMKRKGGGGEASLPIHREDEKEGSCQSIRDLNKMMRMKSRWRAATAHWMFENFDRITQGRAFIREGSQSSVENFRLSFQWRFGVGFSLLNQALIESLFMQQ